MRARNIKPGFFENELLCELSPATRLLYVGLWMLADREGRLEDRPKKIKLALFPMNDLDVDAMLNELACAHFITRYVAGEFKVISIDKFAEHQSPHGTERDSVLPDINGYWTINERKNNRYITGNARLVNSAPTVNARPDIRNPDILNPDIRNEEKNTLTSTSVAVVPDEQDSSNTQPRPGHFGKDQNMVNQDTVNSESVSADKIRPINNKIENCPHQDIVNLYHEILPELPRVRDLTPKRKQNLRARWTQHARFQNLEWWRKYFTVVSENDFLMGRRKSWQANFDFLITASKFQKIIEGHYENPEQGNAS